jgi:hypothetical protein
MESMVGTEGFEPVSVTGVPPTQRVMGIRVGPDELHRHMNLVARTRYRSLDDAVDMECARYFA